LLKLPPLTVVSPSAKPGTDSEKVKVTVAVCPASSAVWFAAIATVGASVSPVKLRLLLAAPALPDRSV
jgi:hypothetical protein